MAIIDDQKSGRPHAPSDTLGEAVEASLRRAIVGGERSEAPFRHWIVRQVFPPAAVAALRGLPFRNHDLGGISGKRELHNDTRHYFDARNNARFAVCAAIARAFQSSPTVDAIERRLGADLAGTYVRLEYAQDIDGFWLEPHTDLGVKKFTMLIYLSEGAAQDDLGTDLYADHETWAKRTAFDNNTALVFVPGESSWHGLAKRPIAGVRRSVIMNYVTTEWRARDQLAFPTTPVRA